MIQLKSYHIQGSNDLELNIKRESSLTYHIAFDDQKEPDGIIFSIPGFGADADINYQSNLIKSIAKTYNLLAVHVEYHCFFSRISNGANYAFDSFDMEIFLDIIERYNIQLDPNHLDFKSLVTQLEEYVSEEKQKDPKYTSYKERIVATLIPQKNEYQNFGILQTIDILTVLSHMKSSKYNKLITKKPIFIFGSSHGAYIANLLMKFAPNTFDAIIENSTYIKPPLRYILGKKNAIKDYEILFAYKSSILIHSFTLSYWSTDTASPYYFSDSNYEIRNLFDQKQLMQFFSYDSKTELISYHCINDTIASFDDKKLYIDLLKKNKHKLTFHPIIDKEQIDGKLIKEFCHSMGMSNKKVLEKHLPSLLEKYDISTPTDFCRNSIISYITSLGNVYKYNFQNSTFFYK